MPAPRRRRDGNPDIRLHQTPVIDPRTGAHRRTAVLASAVLVRQSQLRTVHTVDWQREAWDFYDVVPELHASSTWWSNCLSRVRLFVGEIDPEGNSEPTPVDNTDLQAPLADFFNGPSGQAEMLRRVAVHVNVPGETYLVGADAPQLGSRYWATATSDEFESTGSTTYLKLAESGDKLKLDPEQSMVLRLWDPHARQAWQADSPVRSLRGTLRELQSLAVRLNADIESRLAGAGMLIVPDSATLPAPAQTDEANPLHADPFVAELIRSMVTPITDRDSAAAVVPIVVRTPADAAAAFRYLTFSTPLDEKLILLRDAAIRRFAIGIDQPPESLLGIGDSNHWNAWQIDENGVKLHIEPTCVLLCDAITTRYLRPIYDRDAITDQADRYCVWFDASELAQKTDRSAEAVNLYGMGLLSGEATRRENGFNEDDAPSMEEARINLAVSLAKANPDLAATLWTLLNVPALAGVDESPIEITPARAGSPPVAAPGGGPTPPAPIGGGTPPTPGPNPGMPAGPPAAQVAAAGSAQWLLSAAELGALRALEKAGNRLLCTDRKWRSQLRDVPLWRLHEHIPYGGSPDTLLEGAYACLREAVPDSPCVEAVVDAHVRALIAEGRPHSREVLADRLAAYGCVPGG